MQSTTTTFGKYFVESNKWIATAAELDGSDMHEALRNAAVSARLAKESSYDHSTLEQIMAIHLISLVDSMIATVTA
jgi:hypothetical protein